MASKEDIFDNFDAPKHYIDFTMDDFDEADDSYFDPERRLTKDKHQKQESPQDDTGNDGASDEEATDMEVEEQQPTAPQEPQEQSPHPEEPVRSLTAGATLQAEESTPASTDVPKQGRSARKRRGSKRLSTPGVRQSPRLSNISKALRRTSASRSSLVGDQDNKGASKSPLVGGQPIKKPLPQNRVVRRVAGGSITHEDKKQLETVAVFRDKITNNSKRRKATTSIQPLKATKPQEFQFATDKRLRKPQVEDPVPTPAVPSTRPKHLGPTKAKEFTFATDSRVKAKEPVKGEPLETPMDFTRLLRSNSLSKESSAKKGPTIPKPFHFTETRKPLTADHRKQFVSMAELNLKYLSQTPQRFKRAGSADNSSDSKKPKGPTLAVTPNLSTRHRRRSLSVMSHEEREQMEFEEAQKNAFKARPVNRKVLQTPPSGYQVDKKLPTVPEPFNITETKPRTPLLPKDLIEDDHNISDACLPYGGLPLQGKRTTTKVRPFSFDSRDKDTLTKKQEKIKKIVDEEKTRTGFHARPMPIFEDGVVYGVPPKKPPTPTKVEPFNLQADKRGSIKQERFQQQLEEENRADATRRKFVAQSDQVLHKMPFIPEKSQKPLTELSNVILNTEMRASERSEFDEHVKTMEEDMLAARKLMEERQAADEMAEVKRLRKDNVHKAQPVPNYKPVVIQPSAQPPTVPESPNFATKSRLESSRLRSNSTFSL